MKRIWIWFLVNKAVDGPVVLPVRVAARQRRPHRRRRLVTTVTSNPQNCF
jgi:hypothetical protein